jgi:hypothetical protein
VHSRLTSSPTIELGGQLVCRRIAQFVEELRNFFSADGGRCAAPFGVGVVSPFGKDGLGFRGTGNVFISDKTDDGKAWSGGPVSIDAALTACSELPAAGTWKPPYAYTAKDAATARTEIEAGTGAGHIGPFAQ